MKFEKLKGNFTRPNSSISESQHKVAKIDKRLTKIDDIKEHRWFENVDWKGVEQRRLQPPHFPDIKGSGDRQAYEIRLKVPKKNGV